MSNPFDNFTPEPWTSSALCATHPQPDLWFAGDGINGVTAGPQTRAAQKLCGVCPVRAECLRLALDNQEPAGVWGGLTTGQRNRISSRTAA